MTIVLARLRVGKYADIALYKIILKGTYHLPRKRCLEDEQ